jgi:hypothetical protein
MTDNRQAARAMRVQFSPPAPNNTRPISARMEPSWHVVTAGLGPLRPRLVRRLSAFCIRRYAALIVVVLSLKLFRTLDADPSAPSPETLRQKTTFQGLPKYHHCYATPSIAESIRRDLPHFPRSHVRARAREHGYGSSHGASQQ